MNHSAERSLSTYLTGFALAVVLTAIPFALVWGQLSPARGTVHRTARRTARDAEPGQ